MYAGIVILLRRQRWLRYHEMVVGHCMLLVIGDVARRIIDLQVLCIMRSVLVVDQCGPTRYGRLVLNVAADLLRCNGSIWVS